MTKCCCKTNNNIQCMRDVKDNSSFCWQHQKCQNNNNLCSELNLNSNNNQTLHQITEPNYEYMTQNDTDYILTLEKSHSEYYDKLDKESLDVLKGYTKTDYFNINNYLRYGKQHGYYDYSNIKKQISILKKIINNAPPTTQPMIVYRGMYYNKNNSDKFKVGDVIDIFKLGFNSTTFDPTVARHFAMSNDYEDEDEDEDEEEEENSIPCCIFMLYLPPGVKGIYIGKNSIHDVEDEFILGPGPKFRFFKLPNESLSFIMKVNPFSFEKQTGKTYPIYTYRLACNDCQEIYNKNES